MPLTYEGILELFRDTDQRIAQQFRETDQRIAQQFRDTAQQFRDTDQRIAQQFRDTAQQFRDTDQRIDRMFQETDRRMQETDRRMQETDRRMQETDRQMKETDQRMKATSREISALGSRVGEIVENLVGGDIVEQFRALGYDVNAYSRKKMFGKRGKIVSGEIDLLLEDGDIAILIEAKTTLKIDDVLEHIERLEKYRRHLDEKDHLDRRKLIGAVAGGAVAENVVKFAQKNGLYVIVQAGRTVEILPSPEGFTAKKW